jgi:hypothetical protein
MATTMPPFARQEKQLDTAGAQQISAAIYLPGKRLFRSTPSIRSSCPFNQEKLSTYSSTEYQPVVKPQMCPNLYSSHKPQCNRCKRNNQEGDVCSDEPRLSSFVDVRLHVRKLVGCRKLHNGGEHLSAGDSGDLAIAMCGIVASRTSEDDTPKMRTLESGCDPT